MKRVLGILLVSLATPLMALEDVAAVTACLRETLPTTLRVQQVAFDTVLRDGSQRSLRGRLYAQREAAPGPGALRMTLQIEAPEAYAGAAYLLRESADRPSEGMYVYLPAVRRVRQVSGSFADGPLLNTDFSYREFRLLFGSLGDAALQLEAPDTLDGRATAVLAITPPADATTRYTGIRLWVDTESCLPVQAEFREGESLRKRFQALPGSLRKAAGGERYLAVSRMEDLVEQSRTELRVLGVDLEAPVPPQVFDPRGFYRAP
jgi:hypothetical protein